MAQNQLGAARARWPEWVNTIDKELFNLFLDRAFIRHVTKLLGENERIPERLQMWFFLVRMYYERMCSGIRRLTDDRRDVVSLKRLLLSIRSHPEVVSQPGLGSDSLNADLIAMDLAARPVTDYVNNWIAHASLIAQSRSWPLSSAPPSTGIVDGALDRLYEIHRKYSTIVFARPFNEFDIEIRPDWKAAFTVPWDLSPPTPRRPMIR